MRRLVVIGTRGLAITRIQIDALAHGAINAYTAGATFSELEKLYQKDPKELKELTASSEAYCCYYNGMSFSDVQELYNKDNDKFKALTSVGAGECCGDQYMTFDQLKGLAADKITALTSDRAKEFYEAGGKFQDLQKADNDKFNALTSDDVLRCYNTKVVTPEILNSLLSYTRHQKFHYKILVRRRNSSILFVI